MRKQVASGEGKLFIPDDRLKPSAEYETRFVWTAEVEIVDYH
jgi:hypothetical protein